MLTFNTIGRHQSRLVRTRVASNLSPWLSQCEPGDIHTVAISHGEGRFVCSPELQHQLEVTGRIATQYVDEAGQPSMDWDVNPNGSVMPSRASPAPTAAYSARWATWSAAATVCTRTSRATSSCPCSKAA